MEMSEKADVSLFYSDEDRQRASKIKKACEKIDLRVISYEDMRAGGSQLDGRLALMENSWCVVLIVTEDFARKTMNTGFETEHAVWRRIKENLPKVVPVKCCDDSVYPNLLETIVEIDGSLEPDKIAERVQTAVQANKKTYHSQLYSKVDPVKVDKDYLYRGLQIIDDAVAALDKHIRIDDKMKKFHETMKRAIDEKLQTGDSPHEEQNGPTGCTCQQGELWKSEIHEQKYWTSVPPTPFCNIKKFPGDTKKHTADVHQLYADKGYLKLAAVFVWKSPERKLAYECNNISEYLDNDGILQLLGRCNAFGIREEDRLKIREVRGARTRMAHLPKELPTPEEQQKVVDDVADVVTKSLYGILPLPEWEALNKQVAQIRNGTLKVTIQPEREMEPAQPQEAETNLQTMQQHLERLQVGSQRGPGVSHQQAEGATASPSTDN